MNILVLGWYYSNNLGDAVLCQCAASKLREYYPEAQVVIRDMIDRREFSHGKGIAMEVRQRQRRQMLLRKYATRLGWDKQLRHEQWCLERKRPALEQVAAGQWDAVVFAGGQLFMDSLALYTAALTELFARRGIPVFFNACGTGPSWSRVIQQRLGTALQLENVCYVSCRDDVELVNRWCGRCVAVPISDPALWTADTYRIRKNPRADTVGLGIMFPQSLPTGQTIRFWRGIIRQLQAQGIRWKLFTNGDPGDIALARQVLAGVPQLTGQEEDYLCPASQTPEELVALIAGFCSLISFRLHSHIIAASLDIPTVAVMWDNKLRFFFRKIGHPERCLTIREPAVAVLAALQRAETEGYDRALLDRQREQSTAALLCAMDRSLPHPQNRGIQ